MDAGLDLIAARDEAIRLLQLVARVIWAAGHDRQAEATAAISQLEIANQGKYLTIARATDSINQANCDQKEISAYGIRTFSTAHQAAMWLSQWMVQPAMREAATSRWDVFKELMRALPYEDGQLVAAVTKEAYRTAERLGTSLSSPLRVIAEQVVQADSPAKLLFGWRSIIAALEEDWSDEFKRKVSDLNQRFSGPIIVTGPGAQPVVDKAKLIDWWNRLTIQFEEMANREDGATGSAAAGPGYGRNAVTAPELKGSIKGRHRKT